MTASGLCSNKGGTAAPLELVSSPEIFRQEDKV